MKNRVAAWIILGVVTIAAAFALAYTNEVTKGPIAQQAVLGEEKARASVVPGAQGFEEVPLGEGQALFTAKDTQDGVVGYIGKSVRNGYASPIEVIAGIGPDGRITGVNVGGSAFAETPGLGARAREAWFTEQFKGKTTPVRLGSRDNPGEVDAITAATITSSTVVAAVNQIARQVQGYLNPSTDGPVVVGAEGTTYGASAEGFGGPVAVAVTVKDDGTISALTIGDDQFNETPGYGAGALEPAFIDQFIGKSLPVSAGDVQAISGATVTTNAVLAAINQAFESKNVIAPAQTGDVTYAGSAEGFGGPVAVRVTVGADGRITALTIGDEQFNETPGYGARVLEPEFISQFIGKAFPIAAADVDAVAGATITTNAVIEAVNQAYETRNAVAGPQPSGQAFKASAEGFAGPVAVEVTVADDDTIAQLIIGDDQFNETPGYGAGALEPEFISQFIGKALPVSAADVDAVAGATITTNAVIKAINDAFAQKGPAAPAQTNAPQAPVSAAPAQTEAPQAPATEAPVLTEAPQAPVTEAPAPTTAPEQTVAPEVVVEPASWAREATGEGQGFMGPVAVTVRLNEDGTIASVTIGDERFAETPGYGTLALDESFAASFVGKKPPLAMAQPGEPETQSTVTKLFDADTQASATVTTQAVLDAVNEASASEPAPTAAPEAQDRGISAEQQGFMGPVAVTVYFNADGTIASVIIGDERFAETPGYGALALEEGFAQRFVGKLPPLSAVNPGEPETAGTVTKIYSADTWTYATVTTQAIIDAVNEAYAQRP